MGGGPRDPSENGRRRRRTPSFFPPQPRRPAPPRLFFPRPLLAALLAVLPLAALLAVLPAAVRVVASPAGAAADAGGGAAPRLFCPAADRDDRRRRRRRYLVAAVEGWGGFHNLSHSYAVVQRGLVGALLPGRATTTTPLPTAVSPGSLCVECHYQRVELAHATTTRLYNPAWVSPAAARAAAVAQRRVLRQASAATVPSGLTTTTTTAAARDCTPRPAAPDVTLRFSFPIDLSPGSTTVPSVPANRPVSPSGGHHRRRRHHHHHTFVFATTEYRNVSAQYMLKPGQDLRRLRPDVTIVTPSAWSRDGFLHGGAPPEQVVVLRHGVDLESFAPLGRARRRAVRARLFGGANKHRPPWVVFVSAGAMTSNKGVEATVRAFVRLHQTRPRARLLLKGLDGMYGSRDLLDGVLARVDGARQLMADQVIAYEGRDLNTAEMATLLCAGDVYVSPYRAEGFNMPVQEAAACGLLVVATSLRPDLTGVPAASSATADAVAPPPTVPPPSDEYCDPSFCLGVHAHTARVRFLGNQLGVMLLPDERHLLQRLVEAADTVLLAGGAAGAAGAGAGAGAAAPTAAVSAARRFAWAGPALVARDHSWRRVADDFLRLMDETLSPVPRLRMLTPTDAVVALAGGGGGHRIVVRPNAAARALCAKVDDARRVVRAVRVCVGMAPLRIAEYMGLATTVSTTTAAAAAASTTAAAASKAVCLPMLCEPGETFAFSLAGRSMEAASPGSYEVHAKLVVDTVASAGGEGNGGGAVVSANATTTTTTTIKVVHAVRAAEGKLVLAEAQLEAGRPAAARATMAVHAAAILADAPAEEEDSGAEAVLGLRLSAASVPPMMPGDTHEIDLWARGARRALADASAAARAANRRARDAAQDGRPRAINPLSRLLHNRRASFVEEEDGGASTGGGNVYPSLPNIFVPYQGAGGGGVGSGSSGGGGGGGGGEGKGGRLAHADATVVHAVQTAHLWHAAFASRMPYHGRRPSVATAAAVARTDGGTISVGVLSANVYAHSLGKAVLGVLLDLGASPQFDVTLFVPGARLRGEAAERDFVFRHVQQAVRVVSLCAQAQESQEGQEAKEGGCPLRSTDDLARAAGVLADSRLDVLVFTDVATEPASYALALTRHAPVQVCFWGNPITTAMPWSFDYFVVGGAHDAAGRLDLAAFSEQVVRLGDGFASYYYRPQFPTTTTTTTPSAPVRFGTSVQRILDAMEAERAARDAATAASAAISSSAGPLVVTVQALVKTHPMFDGVVRRLLREMPSAHVVFLAGRGPVWAAQLRDRLDRLAARHGDSGHWDGDGEGERRAEDDDDDDDDDDDNSDRSTWTSRVHIVERLPPREYAALMLRADVLLDSFPYSGFTTSIEALALGAAPVTLAGRRNNSNSSNNNGDDKGGAGGRGVTATLRGTQTAALYRTMGNTFLETACVAADEAAFVRLAVRMATDQAHRGRVRRAVEESAGRLFRRKRVAARWRAFLVRAVRSARAEMGGDG